MATSATKTWSKKKLVLAVAASVLVGSFSATLAQAQVPTTIEGSAGAGLLPMALMHPQGPQVAYTHLNTQDFRIRSVAVGGTISDRVELSFGRLMVKVPGTYDGLDGGDNDIDVNTLGAKVKVLDMSDTMPQVDIGLQHKISSGNLLDTLKTAGYISRKSGTDLYVVATKVVGVGNGLVLNGVLRATKANQMGILGFGGGTQPGGKSGYSVVPEVSVAYFLTSSLIIGAEYRDKPNKISNAVYGIKEEGAYDAFLTYLVNKNMAASVAYVNLGQVGATPAALGSGSSDQSGLYVSVQASF